MNLKNKLLIALIIFVIIVSVNVVNADSSSESEENNVIEVDNIKFNTTNASKFNIYDQYENEGGYWIWYMDENKTGYNVRIYNFSTGSEWEEFDWGKAEAFARNESDNAPSETVNGVAVYTISASIGDHVGEPRFVSYIENRDLATIIELISPDPNETAKMALSVKFN